MSRAAPLLLAALAVVAPRHAGAHEVLHEIAWDRAVALRACAADGDPLAYATYEVYSPADPRIPHQKGRTDREGWLAFVPSTPGRWRVKVLDDTGHGLEVALDASPPALASRAAAPATAALVLRPLVGLAAIAATFGVLLAVQRRRRTSP